MDTVKTILETQRLTKTYGSLTVVKDVSFAFPSGSTCAIVGPSGSGKTTLLGLCAGLDRPSEGRVLLDGTDLGALDENGRARVRNENIGFVFQSFQLIPSLTALENVMVPMDLRGNGGEAASAKAKELLERVGLGGRMTHYPSQMSGGEQQRAALARAFINQPKILFADEPTGNLDSETGRMVIDNLFALNSAFGTTLVIVTHDPDLAARTGRVIRLKAGALVKNEG